MAEKREGERLKTLALLGACPKCREQSLAMELGMDADNGSVLASAHCLGCHGVDEIVVGEAGKGLTLEVVGYDCAACGLPAARARLTCAPDGRQYGYEMRCRNCSAVRAAA